VGETWDMAYRTIAQVGAGSGRYLQGEQVEALPSRYRQVRTAPVVEVPRWVLGRTLCFWR
jgi:hypothetical protein